MSASVLSAMLIGPGWAAPPPPPEPAPVQAEASRELQELREELRLVRELRESLEAQHEASQARERIVEKPLRDRQRVGFGDAVVVSADDEVNDVAAFGSSVRIEGVVRGDATAFGGDIRVMNGAIVYGDALAFGGRVILEDGAQVLGDRVALEADEAEDEEPVSAFQSMLSTLYHRLILLLSFAGAGILVIGLFPKRVDTVAQGLATRPIWSAFIGTLSTVMLVVFAVLFTLLTMGLGLPVGALLMAGLGAAWLFGFVGMCQAIGDQLPFANKTHGRWIAFLVGTVLLTCVGSLGWIGWLVLFTGSMIGVGGAIRSRFGQPS